MKKFIVSLAVIGFFVLFFISCQPVRGADLASDFMETEYEITDSPPLFCSENAESFYETKVLFVVDQTKSNKESDPNKTARKQSIQDVIKQNKDNNLSYGIISFSNQVFSPITLSENDVTDGDIVSFTSDSETLEASLNATFSRQDKSRRGRRYVSVLNEVLDTIKKALDFDQRTPPNKIVDYHIIFISDGNFPVNNGEQRVFINKMTGIVQESKQKVYVHSVYYGNYRDMETGFFKKVFQRTFRVFQGAVYMHMFLHGRFAPVPIVGPPPPEQTPSVSRETDDVRHMRGVAIQGGGYYADQNEESGLKLDLSQKWYPDPFIVYNLNAGFCLNGTVGVDSDMDGLCDEDENNMPGFKPYNRFSFGDGYGDYFHWLAFDNQIPLLPSCSDRNDKDHDLLTDCEEAYISSIDSTFPPLSVDNPDSDGDRILDGIEVLVYLAKDSLAARNPYNLDKKLGENLSGYDKIVQHISPFVPVEEQTTYDTLLVPVEGENGSCYALRSKLPLYPTLPVDKDDTLSQIAQKEGENTLLVYTLRKRGKSDSHVYQFMYRSIRMDSGELYLPVKGNSFQYLPFSNSVEN